jgi:hypothetical protein
MLIPKHSAPKASRPISNASSKKTNASNGPQPAAFMKKLILTGIFLSFLFCYLQWSGSSHGFIFQLEYEVLKESLQHPWKVLHPFTLIPFLGQLLLLLALIRKKSPAWLAFTGIAFILILPLLLLIIALLTKNVRIGASVLPVLGFSTWYFIYWKQHRFQQA